MVVTEPASAARRAPMARLAAATMVGTAVEFYDFYLYTSIAALIFGPLFFPRLSATAGTIAAVATISAVFVGRPVGAVLFGHYARVPPCWAWRWSFWSPSTGWPTAPASCTCPCRP